MAKILKEKDLDGQGIHFAYEVYELVEMLDENNVVVVVKDKTKEVSEQEILTSIEFYTAMLADAQEIIAEIDKIKADKLK